MRTLHLPIAAPCSENWDAMEPHARGRFCERCNKDVHDLSSMTEQDAREFLRARAGTRVCVNYRFHDDGRIHFRAPVRAAALTVVAALAACTPHDPPRPHPTPIHQGSEATPVVSDPVERPTTPAVAEHRMLGEIVAPQPPEPRHMLKGDVAIPNEPCDPQDATKKVQGEVTVVR